MHTYKTSTVLSELYVCDLILDLSVVLLISSLLYRSVMLGCCRLMVKFFINPWVLVVQESGVEVPHIIGKKMLSVMVVEDASHCGYQRE